MGEGKGGMIWENGIETRIISYMKKKEMCNKQEPEEKEKKKKRMPSENMEQTHGERHVTIGEEAGVICLQSKKHQGLLAMTRSQEKTLQQILPQNFLKGQPCQ